MDHDNDALNHPCAGTSETNSGLTAWVELTEGPWALVDCGPCGVRPRRVSGQLATRFKKRAEWF